MVKVFVAEGIGAGVYVFSDDHCPPHVHARHRGEGWVARVRFSYVTSVVELISIAPLKNVPLQRVVNQLLDDIGAHLAICRRRWWEIRRTACLENQWAKIAQSGKIEISAADVTDAKQITAAEYNPDLRRLSVIFRDGTAIELEA
jgi:hypothetical protein